VEEFPEIRFLDYPHEVLAWMTTWFRHLAQGDQPPEVEEPSR
jgi:hypothetical protein